MSGKITEIVLLLGMRGFGKSYRASLMIRKLPRLIAVDPMMELLGGEPEEVWLPRHPDGRVIHFQPDPATLNDDFYVDVPMNFADPLETIEDAALLALEVEDCTLVIDEADLKLGPVTIGPKFSMLIHTSRHYGIGVIATARRAAGLPMILRSQATAIYVFRTVEPRDRQYLMERTGSTPEGLDTLPVGFYWRFTTAWSLHNPKGEAIKSVKLSDTL